MRVALAAAFVLAFATLAPAQTFRGGIQGTVTDQTDAALPGTTVTVTNVGTGLTRSTTTDTSGSYLLSELPLGEYSVAANLQGFATQTVTGVIVEASVNQRIDMQLRPGGVQEAQRVPYSRDQRDAYDEDQRQAELAAPHQVAGEREDGLLGHGQSDVAQHDHHEDGDVAPVADELVEVAHKAMERPRIRRACASR